MECSFTLVKIDFYCCIAEKSWNKLPVTPGSLACISPINSSKRTTNYVQVPKNTKVIQDSGAFNDPPDKRLTFSQALLRQYRHAQRFDYISQVSHVASYDLLIDERWENGKRFKERWEVTEADWAVQETIDAAYWIHQRRNILERIYPNLEGLILSAQGVTSTQYLHCVKTILPILQKQDILGLGGWCITGKRRAQMLPVLKNTMQTIFPLIGEYAIPRIHIWGVIFPAALAVVAQFCEYYGIQLSTDSAGPSVKPCMGTWGYGNWIDRTYQRQPTEYRGFHRIKHVRETRRWLADFPINEYLDED